MKYYSISDSSVGVSLREAIIDNRSGTKDLFMPEIIPRMPAGFIDNLRGKQLREIAYDLSVSMFGGDIPTLNIHDLVTSSMSFDIPLREIEENLYVLELFNGPTLAFKDVGARFLAALTAWLCRLDNRQKTVLVATSGDTGSAVADAFSNKDGFRVVILYPSGKVSRIQERMLNTTSSNVSSLEVKGTFDDCQRMVKSAFADRELSERAGLISANSINFGRLFPQSFYYFYAYSQLRTSKSHPVFSVPSGNFGNITAGVLAREMGLPSGGFVAATNSNNIVPEYLSGGLYHPGPSVSTATNAMDVGNPSNFPRLLNLFGNDLNIFRSAVKGSWFTDDQTYLAMAELYKNYSYLADPHTAIGYLGIKEIYKVANEPCIFLATAHPVKFPETVLKATGVEVEKMFFNLTVKNAEKPPLKIEPDFGYLKEFLLS
jgi:threonine synthase